MFRKAILSVALLLLAVGATAQTTSQFETANMHFDAKDMDADHDGKITKDEMMKYGETMWGMMAKDASTIPVADAGKDFARGNLRFNAKAMDADHDGTISKDEFMKYAEQKFDKMKGSDGMMSVADAAKDFSRGNMHPDRKAKHATDASK
ncbi:MAG: EF-hand domain-containing protein [Steroidobacteraceae bacterium]